MLDHETIEAITGLAAQSEISDYEWLDRGVAPIGFIKGMAVAFATVLQKWFDADSSALVMAHRNTHRPATDALSYYAGIFRDLKMHNMDDGPQTLRHLFVLMMGLGMRETSGRHCCGRDMSAENYTSDTCEAGLFQMSWNARSCSSEMQKLFDEYDDRPNTAPCFLDIFSEEVECEPSDWQCFGDTASAGFDYQRLAKNCPMFAVETTAVGLRKLRKHWGPISRYEAEVRPEADKLFSDVQDLVTPPPPEMVA